YLIHPEILQSPSLQLLFDNEEYDCRTPEDWLALGNAEGSPDRKPIPGKALLPTDDEITPVNLELSYSWHLVGILDYCTEKCQYLVEKVHQTDKKGSPDIKCCLFISLSAVTDHVIDLSKYWIPRIRLLFCAEDPRVFVERVWFALRYREETEALIFYHFSVDCMPISRKTPSLNTDSLQSIKRLISCLINSILDYDRTMNRLIFDKVVMSCPEDLSHITLPQKDPEYVPSQGKIFCIIWTLTPHDLLSLIFSPVLL
uniref:Uncharacterized protein n=1 Tax=Haplochromis burtoni TaxID=8153 RepID=A0A3Q2WPP6_HAPBU